jgi:aminoglycoside phosphotransferase (APT) family kinase protein
MKVIAGDACADAARETWEKAIAAPAWHGPPTWLHGDLHPANVVVRDGTLAGVIDFGEMCAGDPATDLSAAWILLPAGRPGHPRTRPGPDLAARSIGRPRRLGDGRP